MIPIPYGTKYTVEVRGSIWKPVTCEFCSTQFAYQLSAKAKGQAKSILWLNKEQVKMSAESNARQALQRKLREVKRITTKAISCPNCGRYQKDMAQILKTKAANSSFLPPFYGFLTFGAALSLAWLVNFVLQDLVDEANVWLIALGAGIFGGIFVAILKYRKLAADFDPNKNARARRKRAPAEGRQVLLRSELEAFTADMEAKYGGFVGAVARADLPTWTERS